MAAERGITRVALSVALIAQVLALFVGAGGGSFALWNGAAPITATAVRSGTLTATIAVGETPSPTATSASFNSSTGAGMLPGESRSATITVANTGSALFLVAASLDPSASGNADTTFALVPGACSSTPGTPITLGQIPQNIGVPVPAGANSAFCFTVELLPNVSSAMALTFTLLLDANQYRI